ncbi:hypothetical protein HanXRQr2_Chr04g0148891 [Helianthus annuus]|uniref:Uncharacterized protein n=1 Tax=Helianthus annuus TaxID=4232 RepID=A0A9K3NQ69_HELAN|nr:hypothetical protein HanXRQr2_Chr04g0148891 [Helianthus annuus]
MVLPGGDVGDFPATKIRWATNGEIFRFPTTFDNIGAFPMIFR